MGLEDGMVSATLREGKGLSPHFIGTFLIILREGSRGYRNFGGEGTWNFKAGRIG